MSARLRMQIGVVSAVLVPQEALSATEFVPQDIRSRFRLLLVVNDPNLVESRSVIIGETLPEGLVVIKTGLKDGEKFVLPFTPPPNRK